MSLLFSFDEGYELDSFAKFELLLSLVFSFKLYLHRDVNQDENVLVCLIAEHWIVSLPVSILQ